MKKSVEEVVSHKRFVESRFENRVIWLEIIRTTARYCWTEAYPTLGIRGTVSNSNPEGHVRFNDNTTKRWIHEDVYNESGTIFLAKHKH